MEKYLSKNWFYCVLLAVFTGLLWGTTVGFDFVWDDSVLVVQNPSIRSLKNLPKIFTSMYAQSMEVAPSYRPTRTALYALLYALDGKPEPRPWIFHLTNVIWHGIAVMLLFAVAFLLCQRLAGVPPGAARVAAFLIALGFAANPVVTEAVCWVKCLDDLMATVFVLASLLCLLEWNGGKGGYIGALLFFLLAAFSKESAAPFAVLVFFVFTACHKMPWRQSAVRTAPFMLVAAFYVVYRRLVLGQSEQCAPLSGSYGQTLVDMFPVAPKYLRLLLGIPPFSIDYNEMVGTQQHHFFSGAVLGGVIVILAFAGAAAWLWRRETWRLAAFGIIWTGLFLLPVSNLVPMMQYMAERFLYLPLIGFLLALGTVGLHFRRRGVAVTVAGLLVLIWTVSCRDRLGIWRDEVTLFVETSLAHPTSWRLHENAVVAIFNLPQVQPFFRLDDAKRQLLVNHPPQTTDPEPMLRTLNWGHTLFPAEHRFTAALGVTYALHGRMSNAIPLLELATRQQTNDVQCWIDLGTAYTVAGNWPGARQALETALQLSPTNQTAMLRLQELDKKKNTRRAAK